MNLLHWFFLFAVNSVFTLWVLRWGGAQWMEGWKSLFFIEWLYSTFWNAEQIKLYFLVIWLLHALWFVLGLFMPEARVSL